MKQKSESGSATAEAVIVFPVMLVALVFALQLALWAYYLAALHSAASYVEAELGSLSGQPQVATYLAESYIKGLKLTGMRLSQIQIKRSPEESVVSIKAQLQTILPGIYLPLVASVHGVTQRFSR